MAAGDRARAVYANDDAIRHYERALRTLAELPGLRRPGPGRARAAGRSPGAHRKARRGSRALRGGAPGARGGRRSRRRRPPASQDRRTALGSRRSGARQGLLRVGHRAARRRRQPDRARPALPGDRPACVSRRRQCRRHRLGRAGARRSGDGAKVPRPTRSAPARRRQRRRRPTTRWAWRLRARAASSEAVDKIEQSIALAETHDLLQATCRGYTNLGVLYSSLDPRRSIETCLRGPRDREEGRRSRLPVAALCQPCGRLLRADRPLRGRGHRGGANGHRPRPQAGAARSPGGAADRPGPDPPMPRRSRPGLRLVPGGAGASPSRSASRSFCSPATMDLLLSISTPGT